MNKIYIVQSANGQYEDFREWNEKAFVNKEDAEKYAKELDDLHLKKPSFITDEFEEAYNDCYNNLPDWEEGPSFNEDQEAYWKYSEECNKKDKELIVEGMRKKGFDITEEMIDKYEEWSSQTFYDWHNCRIDEIELCD